MYSEKVAEIYYGWEADEDDAPFNYATIPIKDGDEIKYFCYQIQKAKFHSGNLYIIKKKDS